MADYEVDLAVAPVYLLRLYVWELLKRNDPDTWDESKYGDLIPIVPMQEEADLSEFTGPHIVYGFSLYGTGSLPEYETGTMSFVIHDDNFRRLTKTINILRAAFNRVDESARDVNKYTSQFAIERAGRLTIYPFQGVGFGYINVGFSDGGSPPDTEGGRQTGVFNIRFGYFVDYDVITDVTL